MAVLALVPQLGKPLGYTLPPCPILAKDLLGMHRVVLFSVYSNELGPQPVLDLSDHTASNRCWT